MTTRSDLDRELDDMAEAELRRAALLPENQPDHARQMNQPLPARQALTARTYAIDDFQPEERKLAAAVHIGTLAAFLLSGGVLHALVPLVAHLVSGDRSESFRAHMRGQLNFQLTYLIVAVVGIVGSIVTLGFGALAFVPVMLFYVVADIVCSIKAAMSASRGERYRFPFTLDLVK